MSVLLKSAAAAASFIPRQPASPGLCALPRDKGYKTITTRGTKPHNNLTGLFIPLHLAGARFTFTLRDCILRVSHSCIASLVLPLRQCGGLCDGPAWQADTSVTLWPHHLSKIDSLM